jgi:DNA-binding transcriptional LysR family regulator
MNITLKQLRLFVAVVQAGNLAEAASRLFITKAAASMSLQELEKQLDCRLFDRVRNRLQLNTQGAQLLPLADELLQRLDTIEHLFQSSDRANGVLHIGASHTIGNYLLPRLIADFSRLHPHVEFKVEISNTRTVVGQLTDFRLDMALLEGTLSDGNLCQQEWMPDRMLVVAAPDHPLARAGRLCMADLEQQRWLLREQGSGSREQFQRLIGSHLQSWQPGLELNTTESILNAVACGLGLCLLSGLATAAAVRDGRVVVLDLQPEIQRPLRLAWNKEKYLHPVLAEFIAFCHLNTPGVA